MPRQMHINLFIQSRGHHEASWRHNGASKLPLTDIDYTVEMARKGEAGHLDSIFLADVLGLWNDVRATPFNWLEPITTVAAVSMATTKTIAPLSVITAVEEGGGRSGEGEDTPVVGTISAPTT